MNKKNSKIVIITSFMPYRGSETYVINEVLALQQEGVDLIIIPRTAFGPVVESRAQSLLNITLNVPMFNVDIGLNLVKICFSRPGLVSLCLGWALKKSVNWLDVLKNLSILPKSFYLAHILQHEKISHIIAHSTTTVAVIGFVLSKSLNVPWSVVLHSASIANEKHRRLFKALLHSVKFIRSINDQGKMKLIQMFGDAFDAKIECIHLGIDIPDRQFFKTPTGKQFSIVSVGYLYELKGHIYALESAKLLMERGVTNFVWRFIGDGPDWDFLNDRISDMNLIGHVVLSGRLPNNSLLEMYAAGQVDLIVLPSITDRRGKFEGIPNCLIEGMAYGIPVVATDTGGTQELVGDGAGILVPEKDASAIADAVEKLIKDNEYRRLQGEMCRTIIVKKFNNQLIMKKLLQAIEETD